MQPGKSVLEDHYNRGATIHYALTVETNHPGLRVAESIITTDLRFVTCRTCQVAVMEGQF